MCSCLLTKEKVQERHCLHARGRKRRKAGSRVGHQIVEHSHRCDMESSLTVPVVSRWDRMLVFGALNAGALILFVICFTLFPFLTLHPTKFATL